MSYDNHVKWQKTIYFGTQEDASKTGDRLRTYKDENGWSLVYEVDEWGKITMSARRNIGTVESLAQGSDREADISITLNTTQKRAPGMKIIGYDHYTPKFIEIDDRLNRTTPGFKQEDQYYKRVYPASSVLTPEDWFNEQIPDFQALLKDKTFNASVTKITEETSKVQKPYNRNWKNTK